MAIEFRCTHCNKLLRTPDDTGGKQAKCPECGAIVTIPVPGAGGERPSAPPPPFPPGPGAGSPFSPTGWEAGSTPTGQWVPPSGDAANPYASPGHYPTFQGPAPAPGAITHTIIDFGDVFNRTWTIFKDQWGMCLVALIVVWAISVVFNLIFGFGFEMLGAAARDEWVGVVFSLIGNILTSLFGIWIGAGQSLYFLKVARGQRVEISEVFSGGPYFLRLLGASILFGLMVTVGVLLCIVPGIILALMFGQFYFLILDRNLGVMDSLNLSSQLTSGNKLTLFAISVVSTIVAIVVVVCTCFLGLLAVGPFLSLLYPVIYLAMTGQPTADQFRYGPAPAAPGPMPGGGSPFGPVATS